MRRIPDRWVLLVALLVVLGTACTSGKPSGSPGTPTSSSAGAQTYTVDVDAQSPQIPLAADAYFPNSLEVHPGDSVTFVERYSGEPHTVTFGSLVNQSINQVSGTSLVGLPPFIPAQGDPVPSAAQPCFLDTGVPPATKACQSGPQPSFTGFQSFYNSGWLAQGATFSVTVSANAASGTYDFVDLAHPTIMSGKLQVVPVAQHIPSPAEVSRAGADQLAAAVRAQAPAAQEAASVTGTLVAGITESGVSNTFVAALGPSSVTANVRQVLSWTLYGTHALALNPPAGALGLLQEGGDGTIHLNPQVVARVGGVAPPPQLGTKPITVSGGSYSGSAFHNSGVLTSTPPNFVTYTLSFSASGTYTLRCLIHPTMQETIVVG